MLALSRARVLDYAVIGSLVPCGDDPLVAPLLLVRHLDIGCPSPPGEQRRRRRAAVLIGKNQTVSEHAGALDPHVFDIHREREVGRDADRIRAQPQRRRVRGDD